MIEMTGVESKIEGLIQVLTEGDNQILEICRSGKMTMRRGHHTSRVLKAMGAAELEPEGSPNASCSRPRKARSSNRSRPGAPRCVARESSGAVGSNHD